MKARIIEPLRLHMPSETLTSNACPSSKSNVTTQKQVTHLLKRSKGKIGPSKSLWRNISSPSQTAIFFPTPSVFFSGGYSILHVISGQAAGSACCALWEINKTSWSSVSKMASCSDGAKTRQISHSDELLHLPFRPGIVVWVELRYPSLYLLQLEN